MRQSKEIVVRTTTSRDELQAVFRLRHENYLRKEYISADPSGMMFDEWDELPSTTHLIALESNQLVGAIRMVADSASGLPMERVFAKEIASLRKQNRKLAEASTLVTACREHGSDRRIWIELCKAVWQEAEVWKVDDLCIAVTKNHLGFYKRLLFETIGRGKRYGSLNGILAYPLRLRVGEVRSRHKSKGDPRAASLRDFLLETERLADCSE